MASYGGLARSDRNVLVSAGSPVAVPSDFVGMHFGAWPLYNAQFVIDSRRQYPTAASSAPTGMSFGSWRTHADGYSCWYQLETSAGVYDFSNFDTLITTHRSAGRTVVFTVWWTPLFYITAGNPVLGTTHPYAAYPDTTSPNGLTGLSDFITALVTRYNDPAGAWRVANPTLGKGIHALEPMNEPGYTPSSPFWQDSAARLVDFCKTAKDAAKAVDADITFLSPGFASVASMSTFLSATGVINTGTTGASLCEAIGMHFYETSPPCLQAGEWGITAQGNRWDLLTAYQSYKTAMTAGGVGSLPMWCTETGFDGANTSAELTLAANQSASWRYNWWGRTLLVAAALGFRKWMSFSWDTPYLGFPMNDPNGVAKAVNDVHVNVAGKTIKSAYYDVGGAVTLQFTDGSSFAI
jgi:hypothetical protein